jgi:hyperosmotically inducible protein
MKKMRIVKSLLLSSILLFGANVWAANYLDEASITGAVMGKLTAAKHLPASDVKISTYKGVVQLSGFVDNKKQITRAKHIAKQVKGVRQVVNNLLVKTRPDNATTQLAKDTLITGKVKAKLVPADDVKARQIGVNTYNGIVQLSGFVDTQQEIDKASDVAKSVNGVVKVANDLLLKSKFNEDNT